MGNAIKKLAVANAHGRHLCVGLDPSRAHVSALMGFSDTGFVDGDEYYKWASVVIRRTGRYAGAFKANHAFWARYPQKLRDVVSLVQDIAPGAAFILDGKNGDIDNTEAEWASFAEWLGVDAVTINPYMGMADVTMPFRVKNIDCFVLCRTSNKGAAEFQELPVGPASSGQMLFHAVAQSASAKSNGLVVGATDMGALKRISAFVPQTPFLIPGVGKQGGSAANVAEVMAYHKAVWTVNVGRGIAEASDDPDTWPDAVEAAAAEFHTSVGEWLT